MDDKFDGFKDTLSWYIAQLVQGYDVHDSDNAPSRAQVVAVRSWMRIAGIDEMIEALRGEGE